MESAFGELFSLKSFLKGLSGSAGAAAALTTFYPLDLLRTRLQTEAATRQLRNAIVELIRLCEVEGVAGMYRGLGPNIATLSLSNFIYFYTFHGLKHMWPAHSQTAHRDTALAFAAGAVNVFLTAPLWVVSTRIKLDRTEKEKADSDLDPPAVPSESKPGMLTLLTAIYATEGVRGLWQGAGFSLMLCLNPAINFALYEAIKRKLLDVSAAPSLDGPSAFLVGAVSKFCATLLTYPLQVLQSRKRARSDTSLRVFIGNTLRMHGVFGFYRGLDAKLLQTVLTAAFMFFIYEKIVNICFGLFNLTV